jgi:3-dehydroquinate synthetase
MLSKERRERSFDEGIVAGVLGMRRVRIKASKEYNVLIGPGLLEDAGGYIRGAAGGDIAAIVTDDIVAGLYLEGLRVSLRKAGYDTVAFTIKNGEASKNAYTFIRLLDFLAER